MSANLKQRFVVSLLFFFTAAIALSLVLKPFALVCYAVALVLILATLGLALSQTPHQQRKLAYVFTPIIFLVCGYWAYVFFSLLHK